jgi:uncharacterized protein (TIGR03067 family)
MKTYRRNRLGLALVVALTAGVAVAADNPKTDPQASDKDKVQGTWKLVKLEDSGNTQPEATLPEATVVYEGDKYTFTFAGDVEKGIMKWDMSKKPKAVDVDITEGRDKGKKQLGIYEIEGDTLKLCFAKPEVKERPTSFATNACNEWAVWTFKRVKK